MHQHRVVEVGHTARKRSLRRTYGNLGGEATDG